MHIDRITMVQISTERDVVYLYFAHPLYQIALTIVLTISAKLRHSPAYQKVWAQNSTYQHTSSTALLHANASSLIISRCANCVTHECALALVSAKSVAWPPSARRVRACSASCLVRCTQQPEPERQNTENQPAREPDSLSGEERCA